MGRVERSREIARRRARRVKLTKIRKKFQNSKSEEEKKELQAKAARISPFVVLAEG